MGWKLPDSPVLSEVPTSLSSEESQAQVLGHHKNQRLRATGDVSALPFVYPVACPAISLTLGSTYLNKGITSVGPAGGPRAPARAAGDNIAAGRGCWEQPVGAPPAGTALLVPNVQADAAT